MHARFQTHIEAGLESLRRRIDSAKSPIDRSNTERQIGRLLGRNPRASGRYQIKLQDAPDTPAKVRLVWSVRAEWDDWARHSEGCYVLRTNITDWSEEALWKTYIQLSDAEAAFRIHKSDLSIRPIWHQREDRVQAHIFVCFLAYVMWKTLAQWQSRAGLGNSPRTILDELASIQSTDVVLPTTDHPSHELRVRCVVRLDRAQALLPDQFRPAASVHMHADALLRYRQGRMINVFMLRAVRDLHARHAARSTAPAWPSTARAFLVRRCHRRSAPQCDARGGWSTGDAQ